jgi:hypothetical protein
MAFAFLTFWQHCNTDSNNKIKKKTSSLAGLIKALETPHIPPEVVVEQLARIATTDQQRYPNALTYLRQNFPGGIPQAALPPPGQAVPIDFRTYQSNYYERDQYIQVYAALATNAELEQNAKKYHCIFTCKWKSSSGSLGNLGNVASRELCVYQSPPDQPPFNHAYTPFVQQYPTLRYAQPENSLSNTMKFGNNDDDHSVNDPRYLCCSPRQTGRLIMDQWYQYNVTNDASDGNWINIPNTHFLIIKEVVQDKGVWKFRWTKKHAVGNTEKLLYSYDVPLGQEPTKWPKKLTDFSVG